MDAGEEDLADTKEAAASGTGLNHSRILTVSVFP